MKTMKTGEQLVKEIESDEEEKREDNIKNEIRDIKRGIDNLKEKEKGIKKGIKEGEEALAKLIKDADEGNYDENIEYWEDNPVY